MLSLPIGESLSGELELERGPLDSTPFMGDPRNLLTILRIVLIADRQYQSSILFAELVKTSPQWNILPCLEKPSLFGS